MALPQDGQDANGLTKVTQIPAGKELMFIDPTTNEGGIITLEDLTKQILNGLTSQTFGLDSGTQTLPAAINYLYGNCLSVRRTKIQKSETISAVCLNSLVLIISTSGGMYDLYACIGYQADAQRSKIQLLSGNGNHKIAYSSNDSAESVAGIYKITNGNKSTYADVYIIALRK